MMKYLLAILCLLCVDLHAQSKHSYSFDRPPSQAELFQEGLVSTFLNERDFAISPDGTEIFFTVTTPRSSVQTIVFCKKQKNGKWSKPEIVSFGGTYSDLEPAFGPDGNTLFFASNRPLSQQGPVKDFDIWKVDRQDGKWLTPVNLGLVVNTNSDEFYPSITKNGNLYFTAAYAGGVGKEDIYVATADGTGFQKPIPLDTAVNSTSYEFNAFVSPDERFILFTSYGRKDDKGGGDLYISVKENGKWKKAVHLSELSSPRLDYCPYVSPDGKALFFTSEKHALPDMFNAKANYQTIIDASHQTLNGNGNIFWCSFDLLRKYLPQK